MNNRSSYLIKYFGDRFILLKEEWLTVAIEFIESRIAQSKSFDDEKFAKLIFEQWKCADFQETSFPVFENHGIQPSTSKMESRAPIVCQINSIIDISTAYYSQYCKLENKSIDDHSGFEKVFHEKEEDYDKKFSRMLHLTLTDGESYLKGIELSKISQLSMYIKPGCKVLIIPPVKIRKGTFLLKATNCQILGGECLPLLISQTPLERYKRYLGIFKESDSQNFPDMKKPPEIRPSTSVDDDYPNLQDFEDMLHEEIVPPSPPSFAPVVTVSSFSTPLDSEELDFSKTSVSPSRKRLKQSTIVNIPKPSGMLKSTTIQFDSRNDDLENRIEDNEEPISISSHRRSMTVNRCEPPAKKLDVTKVKIEKEDDEDDIEIIEIDDSPPIRKSSEISNKNMSNDEKLALSAFLKLSLIKIIECTKKMKYCIGSRRFLILSVVDDIVEPLRVVDNLWTMKIKIKDESATAECYVDNPTLEGLIGFTCHQAIEIRKSCDAEKKNDGKRRLQALEEQLQRLDLVFEVEFFNGSVSLPIIRKIKTMAEQLDAY